MIHESQVILPLKLTFKMIQVFPSRQVKACLLTLDSSHDFDSSIHIPAHHHHLMLVVLVQGAPETRPSSKVVVAGLHELSDTQDPAIGDGLAPYSSHVVPCRVFNRHILDLDL